MLLQMSPTQSLQPLKKTEPFPGSTSKDSCGHQESELFCEKAGSVSFRAGHQDSVQVPDRRSCLERQRCMTSKGSSASGIGDAPELGQRRDQMPAETQPPSEP